ncbi:MAG TPA: M23 family metallopeptidase [Puia sp.]|nr:M23 family metallopeptidase [Puia sp.]
MELDVKDQNNSMLLSHRLKFQTSKMGVISTDSATITSVMKEKDQLRVIGPPLGSGAWAAVYDPSWRTGHRRVIYTVDGHAGIPGRFAIDFIKLDKEGRLAKGNDDIVKDWYGYAAEVLAVADGIVASVRNDFSETVTVSGRDRVGPERATGNYISIRVGKNKYAFYEHLKPGSIKVKPGQNVKKGQVLASLGFTGQSDGPHLHFHMASKNSPLGAEGIPFVFERFTYLGKYKIDSLGKSPWLPFKQNGNNVRLKERPLPNSVISFKSLQ